MDDLGFKSVYRFGAFTLDTACRSLSLDGETLALAPKEFLTLALLVQASGQAVQKETLITAIWPDTVVSDNSLARNISSLRRHLGSDAIEVVPKFGYRFALPVTLVETQTPLVTLSSEAIPDPPTPVSVTLPAFWQRPATRFWGAVAAFLFVAGLSAARFITPKQAKAAAAPMTWTDPQTKLMWAGTDNGVDVNHQQAVDFCHSLNLAGYSDWQLPTIDEVQTLYDTGVSIPGVWGPQRPVYWHVKGNLHITGGETASNLTWLTDQTPAGEEQSFDFSYGRRNYDPTDFSPDHRALCVRPTSN